MAAITATYYSVELALVRAAGNEKLKPNQLQGRIRIARFSYETVETDGLADGETVFACKLPKGARVMGGVIKGEAMGGTAAVDIGAAGADGSGLIDDTVGATVADDDDLFLAAGDVSSAFNLTFADTIARNYGYETLKEIYLVLTAETAAWAAEKDLVGHVEYVVD